MRASAFRRRAAYLVVLVAATALLLAVTLPLWKPLLLAAVFAAVLRPAQRWLASKLGERPAWAAGILCFGVVVLLLVPLGGLVVLFLRWAPQGATMLARAAKPDALAHTVDTLPPPLAALGHRLLARGAELASMATAQLGPLTAAVGRALSTTSGLVFAVLLMLIALFVLLLQAPALVDWLAKVSPLGARRTRELIDEVRRTGVSTVVADGVTAAVQAAVATVGYVIFDAPVPLLLGALTFVAAFIPTIGTALVTFPACFLLVLLGRPWAALGLLAYALLVVGLVDNVVRPYLIHGATAMSGPALFFSILGGIFTFGAMGIIVGPLALSFFLAVVRMGVRDFARRPPRALPTAPVQPPLQ
ncbi:MAG: AI-2E family transporter [Deltaproteobacteria bacterium]|nr:AI-2E family transporter [Deltaproteobacteria bacterium]